MWNDMNVVWKIYSFRAKIVHDYSDIYKIKYSDLYVYMKDWSILFAQSFLHNPSLCIPLQGVRGFLKDLLPGAGEFCG